MASTAPRREEKKIGSGNGTRHSGSPSSRPPSLTTRPTVSASHAGSADSMQRRKSQVGSESASMLAPVPHDPLLQGQLPNRSAPCLVLRSCSIADVTIQIVQSDIVDANVDSIVNAANSLSFTPMDGGVSGALRRACKPDEVTGKKKRWWDENGAEHADVKLPTTQAGVQPAAGSLRERGVKHIIHAVGPIWTDYPIAEATFKAVLPQIKRTVKRALQAAVRIGAQSCALPAISGGIFTHWRENSDIKDREQRAARKAVLEAVMEWAEGYHLHRSSNTSHATDDSTSSSSTSSNSSSSNNSSSSSTSNISATTSIAGLSSILLCDLHRRQKGAVHVFVEEFDALLQKSKQEKVEHGDAASQLAGEQTVSAEVAVLKPASEHRTDAPVAAPSNEECTADDAPETEG
jgi:O-acetyl-ADP-ribose deacetylase (regulator of RNase III)